MEPLLRATRWSATRGEQLLVYTTLWSDSCGIAHEDARVPYVQGVAELVGTVTRVDRPLEALALDRGHGHLELGKGHCIYL
jgi:hypothetical protein